jgi:CRISPR-associated protein Csx17
MSPPLRIIPFLGIHTDSLGHYLMGLGLLRAVSAHWPTTLAVWREGVFHLVAGFTQEVAIDFLLREWKPTPYERWWAAGQKVDTKAKTGRHVAELRSSAAIPAQRAADATLVGVGRNQFNPLFGTGGNVGKRDLASAWKEAHLLRSDEASIAWLRSSLFGEESTEVPPFRNAGTWFVQDNKTFNSGLEWYREGSLSPWSFLLAMEGALLIRGGSGRRLGARARPYAVFPFVSQALSPAGNEEVGQKLKGEFWAPMWEQPMLLAEVRALFQRGLARLGGRAATAPHEFAAAALAAGADAGVTQFARFELRQTTSAQVYEALPRGVFPVGGRPLACQIQPAELLMEFLGQRWFDALPYEPASRESKLKFRGLRGPLERLILSVGHEPENPDAWRALLLRLAQTQASIDRNLELRKACRALPPLSVDWLARLFPDGLPPALRIAVGLAALGGQNETPTAVNIFGIEGQRGRRQFVRVGRPRRVVWHEGEPLAALLDLVQRRLTDARTGKLEAFGSRQTIAMSDVANWLTDAAKLSEETGRWLPALGLLDWSRHASVMPHAPAAHPPGPELLLWAFFKPFFSPAGAALRGRGFFRPGREAKPAFARELFNLLRHGAVAEAISLAAAGYHAESLSPALPAAPDSFDARAMAVALALPVTPLSLGRLVERWLEPSKKNSTLRQT